MQFSLIGFRQDTGFRVFTFEGTAADRTRTAYTVRADLALTRKHGIRVQELPLLCRGVLERAGEGEQKSAAIFTEEEMRLQLANLEDDVALGIGHSCLSLGSSRSRSQSPNTLTDSTSRVIAMPGISDTHHASAIRPRASGCRPRESSAMPRR